VKGLSLRFRLTVWYSLALLVTMSLGGAVVLREQDRVGIRRVDRELDAFAGTLRGVLADELTEHDDVAVAAEDARTTVTVPGRAVAILDAAGHPLAANWAGLNPSEILPVFDSRDGGVRVWTAESPTGGWRVHAVPHSFKTTGLVLLVAAPLSDLTREQREVREAMVIGIPIALLIAAGGGLYLASVGLRPITEALRTQRQFMADASHELRTPVSVVRVSADVALNQEHRDEGEYREALAIVAGEAQRLSRLVDDMLVLARADGGGYALRPVDLYFDEIVAECQRAAEVLAAERGVSIRSIGAVDISVSGDEDLLRRLVLNVLQNAVQHSPPGGEVELELTSEPGRVRLRISDRGPGIPQADQARIFDRFVQLDVSRGRQGTGLGLPIARWIAEAHRGTLVLEKSGPGGSTFTLVLPANVLESRRPSGVRVPVPPFSHL
jgi:signal transduction histidine kinase